MSVPLVKLLHINISKAIIINIVIIRIIRMNYLVNME